MKKKKGRLGLSNSFHYTLMVLPGYIWLFMFSIVPMVGIVMAFQDYNPSKGWFGSPWVGLKWFKYLTVIPDAKRALVNTLIIAIAKVILNIIIPLVFALLLNEVKNMKFKKTVQTIVYLPHFVSWVILANIITNILGANGIFNTVRSAMGATDTVLPMTMPGIFRQLLIGTDVWKEFGYNAVIYLAALTGISPELYEAAAIDGAGIWQRIIHIMIPAIKKLAGTLLILQIISVFQIMYEPMVLTKGGPDNASLSLMQLMWQYAFGGSMNYGKASAVAVIVTLILLVMTAIYSYFDRKESDWD